MPGYRIQILEVGCVPSVPADFVFDGVCKNGEFIYNPFSFTLLRSDEKNILIDCGINLTAPEYRDFFNGAYGTNGHGADEVLATVGLAPDDIDAIIITHAHWDHLSGLVYFPKAEIFIQREEYTRWREISANPAYSGVFFRQIIPADLEKLAAADRDGRVTFLDGDADNLFPGIHVRAAEFGHSFAQQLVLIDTDGAPDTLAGNPAITRFVHAGDVCNRPENLIGTPEHPGYVPNVKFSIGSVLNTLHDYDKLLALAGGDISRILMTHDGTRIDRLKSKKSPLGLMIFDVN